MPQIQPEPRVPVDLPVRVWGMTAQGRPFSQQARARNISSEGALIGGVENELQVGDVIGMQCEEKKSRCTVVWIRSTGAARKNQVGVRVLADYECPWKTYLPIRGGRSAVPHSKQRRYPRHKISFPLVIREEHLPAPLRISATDVSGNGCYIETLVPLPVQTSVRVDLFMQAEHINMAAAVRTCDPGVGNGIEFTGLPTYGKQRLQDYLDGIDPPLGVARPKG
jgi:PilZ domain